MSRRLDDHINKGVAVGIEDDLIDYPHRQPAREDQIAACRHHRLSRLNAIVFEDAHNLQPSAGVAAQDAADARRLQNHARPTGLVVDHQHLRRVRIDLAQLAHNAVGGDDGHIRRQALARAFVDVEDARAVAAARSDRLRRQRLVDVLLLEVDQRLQAFALACVFQQRGLFQAQPVDRLLQLLVLFAHPAQVQIIRPELLRAQLAGVHQHLRRRDHRIGPKPDQAHAAGVGGIQRAAPARGAPHLHGQPDDLRQQDCQQHQQIPVADEEGFHGRGLLREGELQEQYQYTDVRSWRQPKPLATAKVRGAGARRSRSRNQATRIACRGLRPSRAIVSRTADIPRLRTPSGAPLSES